MICYIGKDFLYQGFLLYAATDAADAAAWVAIPPAMMADTTTSSAVSRTSGGRSAPTLPRAAKAAPGSVNNSCSNSPGSCSNATAIATSAVTTTPLSSSTGVLGARLCKSTVLTDGGTDEISG